MNALFGAGLVLVGIVLAAAASYWYRIGANPVRCILANDACSLTFATYVLAGLTLFVFWATSQAAVAAWQAFRHERRVVLAVQRCDRDSPRQKLNRRGRLSRPHLPSGGRLEVFLVDADVDGLTEPPPDFVRVGSEAEDGRYQRRDFDVLCAGRSPVVQGVLVLLVGETKKRRIPIGSMPAGERLHLVIWLGPPFRSLSVAWATDSATHADEYEIAFFPPPDREIVRVENVTDIDQLLSNDHDSPFDEPPPEQPPDAA